MAGQLTNLDPLYLAGHDDVMVWTALHDDLRLVGGGSSLVSGLVVHGVL